MNQLLVPVDLKHGGILHDTDCARGADDRADAERIDAECMSKHGHTLWGADYVMEAVEPFRATLRVVEAGHKNGYVWLGDVSGVFWPMFMTDYVALMSRASVHSGWIEHHTYETCKKGARAYGIRVQEET